MSDWWLPLTDLVVGLVAAVAAWLLTGAVRRYALGRLLDHPNERSSHQIATPRGGGLGFVLIILVALPVLAATGYLPVTDAWAFAAAGAVAAVGFVDDHRPLGAGCRLLVHAVAAAWGLWWLGGMPAVVWGGESFDLGWPGHLLAWLGLIWLLNLYNFMDGIDAIAGTEAVTVVAAMAVVTVVAVGNGTGMLHAIIGGSVLGFLIWNLPPARIFMGDIGSGFLGLLLGLMAIATAREMPQLLWSWAIILACFITDATWTLGRRLWRGERVHQPHRSHAYQRAARRWGSHGRVSAAIGLINTVWLLPWAWAVAVGIASPAAGMLAAYAAVLLITFWLGAGSRAE